MVGLFGKELGRIWGESGEDLGRIWGRSGEDLRKIWGESGEDLGRIWAGSGEDHGRIWEDLGKYFFRKTVFRKQIATGHLCIASGKAISYFPELISSWVPPWSICPSVSCAFLGAHEATLDPKNRPTFNLVESNLFFGRA